MKEITADILIESLSEVPLLDVRSPSEYQSGHIPNAISFPLFTDQERKEVGTSYKQINRDSAIKLGLEFVGPKLKDFVENAEQIAPGRKLNIHCWRGGMRSGSMAWLLKTAGFQTSVLKGGYKAYRQWGLELFDKKEGYITLGGYTGSGKTEVIEALSIAGESAVDLEKLACHKGSAFGPIGQPNQPNTEQFQNNLFLDMYKQPLGSVWLEDEASMIGTVSIPVELYRHMQTPPFVWLDVRLEDRIDRLVLDYGAVDISVLKEKFIKITKRLGGLAVKEALHYLDAGNLRDAAAIALKYYDKAYKHAMDRKKIKPEVIVDCTNKKPSEIAEELIAWKQTKYA